VALLEDFQVITKHTEHLQVMFTGFSRSNFVFNEDYEQEEATQFLHFSYQLGFLHCSGRERKMLELVISGRRSFRLFPEFLLPIQNDIVSEMIKRHQLVKYIITD